MVSVPLWWNGLCSSVFIRNSQNGNTPYKKILDTCDGSEDSNPESRSPSPQGGGYRESSRWGLSGYNTENLTSDQNGYGVLRVFSFLYVKNLFCRFRKRVGALE